MNILKGQKSMSKRSEESHVKNGEYQEDNDEEEIQATTSMVGMFFVEEKVVSFQLELGK